LCRLFKRRRTNTPASLASRRRRSPAQEAHPPPRYPRHRRATCRRRQLPVPLHPSTIQCPFAPTTPLSLQRQRETASQVLRRFRFSHPKALPQGVWAVLRRYPTPRRRRREIIINQAFVKSIPPARSNSRDISTCSSIWSNSNNNNNLVIIRLRTPSRPQRRRRGIPGPRLESPRRDTRATATTATTTTTTTASATTVVTGHYATAATTTATTRTRLRHRGLA